MEVIRELFVLLGVEADKADFDKAERSISNVKKLLSAAALAAAGLGAALAAATNQFARETEEIDAWAAKIGASVETLSGLKVAFESIGLEGQDGFEAITDAAEKAGDVLKNIKSLTGDAGESFKALGFKSVRELAGADGNLRNSLDLFRDLIGRLKGVENQGERTGIAMRLFGDDVGRRVIPFIERYGDRLDEVIQSQGRFGAIITDSDVTLVREYRGAFAGVAATVRGLAFVVGRNLLPPLTRVLNRVSDWVAANRVLIRQRIGSVVQAIARTVEFAFTKTQAYARSLNTVVEALGGWKVVLGALGIALAAFTAGQVGSLIVALGSLLGAVKGVSAATVVLRLRMIAIGGIFAAFLLVMDDVITTIQGGDSVISRFVKRFGPEAFSPDDSAIVKVLRSAIAFVQQLGTGLAAVIDLFAGTERQAAEAQGALMRFWEPITRMWKTELDAFGEWLDSHPYIKALIDYSPIGIAARAGGFVASGGVGDLVAQGVDSTTRFFQGVQAGTDTANLNPEDAAILRFLAGGAPAPLPAGVNVGPPASPTVLQQSNSTTITVNGNADAGTVDEIGRRIDASNAEAARRLEGAVEQ